MAVTRLKRKDRRNKAKAANRIKRIKQLSRKPVIKNLEDTAKISSGKAQAAEATSAAMEEE